MTHKPHSWHPDISSLRDALGIVTAIPFKDCEVSREPALISIYRPNDTEWDTLHYLRYHRAVQIGAVTDRSMALVTHIDPYMLSVCANDLKGDLRKHLNGAKPVLEDLTNVPWTLNRASLSAAIPYYSPGTRSKPFLDTIAGLVELGLIEVDDDRVSGKLHVIGANSSALVRLNGDSNMPVTPQSTTRHGMMLFEPRIVKRTSYAKQADVPVGSLLTPVLKRAAPPSDAPEPA